MDTARAALAAAPLALAVAAPPVIADPTIEVAPYIAYRGGGGFMDRDTENDADVDESASFGVAISRALDPGRRLELWYSRQATEVTGEGDFTGDPLFDLEIHYLHLGGTVEVDEWSAFRSFVSGGIGITHF